MENQSGLQAVTILEAPMTPSPQEMTAEPGAGSASGTLSLVLDGQPIQVGVTLTSTPPAPSLSGLVVSPGAVVGGQAGATGTVTISPAQGRSTVVVLSSNSVSAQVPPTVMIPAGLLSTSFSVTTTAVSTPFQATLSATLSGLTLTAPLTLNPVPAPIEINVKDYGATGNSVTDDRLSIQRAIDAAAPGQVVRFPTGTYSLGGGTLLLSRSVKLIGAGGKQSTLKSPNTICRIGQATGPAFPGVEIRGLHFYGQVGVYKAQGNEWPGVQNLAGQGLVVDDCDFSGCGACVTNMGVSYGSILTNLRCIGWGSIAFFCNGGETIKNCRVVQDDPGIQSSHAFYIHSNTHDILIEDCWAENAKTYGFQLYGEEVPSTIQRVTIRRTTFKSCRSGGTIYQPQVQAARSSDVLIEGCQFLGTTEGGSLNVTGGDRITVRNCIFDGGTRAFALGVWAPSQVGFNISGLTFAGNQVRNQSVYGIWELANNGGTFSGCVVGPNQFSGCKQDISKDNAPGISWL